MALSCAQWKSSPSCRPEPGWSAVPGRPTRRRSRTAGIRKAMPGKPPINSIANSHGTMNQACASVSLARNSARTRSSGAAMGISRSSLNRCLVSRLRLGATALRRICLTPHREEAAHRVGKLPAQQDATRRRGSGSSAPYHRSSLRCRRLRRSGSRPSGPTFPSAGPRAWRGARPDHAADRRPSRPRWGLRCQYAINASRKPPPADPLKAADPATRKPNLAQKLRGAVG